MAESLLIKVNGLVDNHTARRLAPVVPTQPGKDDGDIVEYARKQKVKKVGEGSDDYLVYEDVEEVSRVNRHDYIQAQCSDIGVLNILEKVRRSGDLTLLNQNGAIIPEDLQDYTNVPKSAGEALNAIKAGGESFTALQAIFGDISFNDLASMSEDQLAAAVNAYIAKNTPKKEGEE